MNGTPGRKVRRTLKLVLTIQYGTRQAQLPSRAKLRQWARAALSRTAMVTLRLIGAREARRLNRDYRGRDYATNVLTFLYSARRPLNGDIAICAPVVAREARAGGLCREAHYAHLTVHGMLHLQGYDHQHAAEAQRMEKREARILARLGYPDPYAGEFRNTPALQRKRQRATRDHGR